MNFYLSVHVMSLKLGTRLLKDFHIFVLPERCCQIYWSTLFYVRTYVLISAMNRYRTFILHCWKWSLYTSQLRKKLFLYIKLHPISLLSICRKSATNSTDDKISKSRHTSIENSINLYFIAWMRFLWFNLSPATSHLEVNYKNVKTTAP